MQLANNIDVVQINIKSGVDEYYLPKNVNWRDRVIDKIVLALAPVGNQYPLLSPIDGTTEVFEYGTISDLYFDLYAADDTQIVRNLYFEQLLISNNNIPAIGAKLSLNLSRLYFTNTPQADGCILLYIYYGGKDGEVDATQSVTVNVPLAANASMSLQDIVDNYIMLQPETIKGIYVWDADEKPVYITLRERTISHTKDMVFHI